MLRLYLRTDPSIPYSAVIPVWRNFCDHLRAQLFVQHPDLPAENFLAEWRKVRDLHLEQWQATVNYTCSVVENYDTLSYLEFADSESLLAFKLAWS